MQRRYGKNQYMNDERRIHTARWEKHGVGTIPEIHEAINASAPEDVVKVCNKETRRHVKLKCQELLDTINLPKRDEAKEEELKRELMDMLVYERLIYTDEADESNRERSPVNLVRQSGLPSYFVNCIIRTPGWNFWFTKHPLSRYQ
jgi:uncharacterized membrane-anchored protein YjiN (DUF445 family)